MNYSLAPSFPAPSFEKLAVLAQSLKGVAPQLQVDIVDGQFASPECWPFAAPSPDSEWAKLSSLVSDFEVEVDCMVRAPEQYLDTLAGLGVQRIVVHVGSTTAYSAIIKHAKTHAYKLGFACTNDVPVSFLYPYIDTIDFVQIMGIAQVGAQGQSFDERTIETVRALRSQYPALEIAVDGSVNEQTIPLLLAAGANRFAPGSAITQAEHPAEAYKQLLALLPQQDTV